jgi:hypothetical protein
MTAPATERVLALVQALVQAPASDWPQASARRASEQQPWVSE